ncbi:thioredoxin [Hoeflea sp. YIM 152468]|uniref:thioredoxin n=1 Tax=Hoeflea sp. YIM 152468 TaxID=3031759 RepID=UPI0023DC24BE|nr:thioredoxin [Hoeflea sp. YIM 152468]MDF1608243.1 thioredoxin [Hoeflea sp. YIM 152468]
MSDYDNPYAPASGGQMSGTVTFGDTSKPAQTAAANAGEVIMDTTTAGFADDVIKASADVTVLVDFWAPWCGPCKQLTPIIEKVVRESNGRVKLVKLNIDDHPAIPGQMGIQSIPAVIAFSGGKPVDGFMGALPESQIRDFIDKVAGPAATSSADDQIAQVLTQSRDALAAGDVEAAARGFGAILQMDQEHVGAIAGMAACMLAAGELDRAEKLLSAVPEDERKDLEVAAVFKRLEMAREVAELGNPAELQARLASDPADHEARIQFAKILNARGDRDAAAAELFTIMRTDPKWQDEAARKALLEFFEAWGPMDAATLSARRQLSSLLFS